MEFLAKEILILKVQKQMNNQTNMAAPDTFGAVYEKRHFDKVALIDADRIKHLVAFKVFELLQQNYTKDEIDLDDLIENQLERINNSFSAKAMIWCFSGRSYQTFRYHVGFEREYKGQRKTATDSSYYETKFEDMMYVVSYIQRFNHTLVFSELEADDVLSMLQNQHTFIYSNDKDLKQVPGLHFDTAKQTTYTISEEDAMRNLCKQMLMGDSTDGIVGLPRVGEKIANKILIETPVKQMHHRILLEYQKRFGITNGTDAFVETWNLVKLRPCRGTYFLEKFAKAFELRDYLSK